MHHPSLYKYLNRSRIESLLVAPFCFIGGISILVFCFFSDSTSTLETVLLVLAGFFLVGFGYLSAWLSIKLSETLEYWEEWPEEDKKLSMQELENKYEPLNTV